MYAFTYVHFAISLIRVTIHPWFTACNLSGATNSGASARWSLMTRKCGRWQWERQAAWVLVLRMMVSESHSFALQHCHRYYLSKTTININISIAIPNGIKTNPYRCHKKLL